MPVTKRKQASHKVTKRKTKKRALKKRVYQRGFGYEPHSKRCSNHHYVEIARHTTANGVELVLKRCTKCDKEKIFRYIYYDRV